ncbi:MAG: outer membrane protein assembly factor BamC [Oligoflexia bacterium]|nr:outer membrane protein assembly factor BamC [Oligoflexia bacterium]
MKQNKAASRIFLSDFATAWTAALEAASAGRDIVRIQNRETGTIETNWIDNSISRQFLDVFSDEDFFLRMRYKLQIHVREGKKNEQTAVLIRVIKYQQKESTFLGGWQDIETDGIEESVYLYRIGRLIAIQQYTEEQEQNRNKIEDGDTFF